MRFWDSSAVVALLVEQDATDQMQRALEDDGAVAAWWATVIECSSAIARLEREQALSPQDSDAARRKLELLASSWDEVQPSERVRRAARRLLRLHPLGAADALQGAAAVVAAEDDPTSLEVVCLDGRLWEALRLEGFSVLPAGLVP